MSDKNDSIEEFSYSMTDLEGYFATYPSTPTDKKDPKKSVHSRKFYERNPFRFDKAAEEANKSKVTDKKIEKLVNGFLEQCGYEKVKSPKVSFKKGDIEDSGIRYAKFDYKKFQEEHDLANQNDIVWLKFTKDGYLGAVGVGSDINFSLPPSEDVYDDKEMVEEKKGGFHRTVPRFKYNTTGILVHSVDKKWDESFALVFPLVEAVDSKKGSKLASYLQNTEEAYGYRRKTVQRGIGNFLISQGVPIIDFYGHNY